MPVSTVDCNGVAIVGEQTVVMEVEILRRMAAMKWTGSVEWQL